MALTRTASFGYTSLYQKLMIMESILLTVQNESFLLSTINERTLSQLRKISEGDTFFKVRSPIIDGLINVNKRLRLKSGETVNLVSTAAKKQLYSEAQQIIGFKVDTRIVYDFEDQEIDLCAGEISKGTSSKAKVWHDDSKFIRERNDILNQLYDLCGNRKNHDLQLCFIHSTMYQYLDLISHFQKTFLHLVDWIISLRSVYTSPNT